MRLSSEQEKEMPHAKQHKSQLGQYWLTERSGVWYITWVDDNRVTRRRSTRTKDFAEAEQQLAAHFQIKANIKRADPGDISVPMVLARYYDKRGQHVRSAKAIKRAVQLLTEFWPDAMLDDLTLESQQEFCNWMMEQGASPGYTQRNHGVLATAINFAWKHREITIMPPLLSASDFPETAVRDRILELDEMARFWDTKMPNHLRLWLMLSICTTGRPEAILDIQTFQVNLTDRVLNLNPPGRVQNKKRRPRVPICDTLYGWLPSAMNSAYLVNWHGRHIKCIRKTFKQVAAQAGMADIYPYIIRHTMGAELRRRNVPEREAKGIMGHLSEGAHERHYGAYRPDYQGEAAKAIDAYCAELGTLVKRPVMTDVVPIRRTGD
jgi:integrase